MTFHNMYNTQWSLTLQVVLRFKESFLLPPAIPSSLNKGWRVGIRHWTCRVYKRHRDSLLTKPTKYKTRGCIIWQWQDKDTLTWKNFSYLAVIHWDLKLIQQKNCWWCFHLSDNIRDYQLWLWLSYYYHCNY